MFFFVIDDQWHNWNRLKTIIWIKFMVICIKYFVISIHVCCLSAQAVVLVAILIPTINHPIHGWQWSPLLPHVGLEFENLNVCHTLIILTAHKSSAIFKTIDTSAKVGLCRPRPFPSIWYNDPSKCKRLLLSFPFNWYFWLEKIWAVVPSHP